MCLHSCLESWVDSQAQEAGLLVRVEQLDSGTWAPFLEAPISLLVLGKTGCEACKIWAKTLSNQMDEVASEVRVGTLLLDAPGLAHFKIAHPWIALVDVLPFNALYINGERVAEWAGGSIERLQKELNGRA
jgi:hypothetical protein